MGPPLEATRGSRSPPVMLASLDPFEAFGLSGCEEQKEKVRMHIKSFLSLILDTVQVLTQEDCVILCWKQRISSGLVQLFIWGKMLHDIHVTIKLSCFNGQNSNSLKV